MISRPLLALCPALLLSASCIAGDLRVSPAADAEDEDAAEVVDTTDTADGLVDAVDVTDATVGNDGDATVECDEEHACIAPTAPCAEASCEAGRCIVRPRESGSPCDDHNPCTGDGSCDGDVCQSGAALEDGRPCDDDTTYCNGYGECRSGQCSVSVLGSCPQPDVPCVDHWACSEALQGKCGPVASEDGTTCGIGSDVGQCQRGACVPRDMMLVDAGVFIMGCDAGALCALDARPKHDVELSAFAIDVTEVTEGVWKSCVAAGACPPRVDEDEAGVSPSDAEMPLRWVDWEGADAICVHLGKRLCTEAEWEKAARGTDGGAYFPWGNTPATCERAQFWDLRVGKGCGTGGPALVGGRAAGVSPYGALDMAGNVAEWVFDGYDATTYTREEPGTPRDPRVGVDGSGVQARVIRGGGWDDGVDALRVFTRQAQSPTFFDEGVGVRCCWSALESEVTP